MWYIFAAGRLRDPGANHSWRRFEVFCTPRISVGKANAMTQGGGINETGNIIIVWIMEIGYRSMITLGVWVRKY